MLAPHRPISDAPTCNTHVYYINCTATVGDCRSRCTVPTNIFNIHLIGIYVN